MNAIVQEVREVRLERQVATSDRVAELEKTISASRLSLWLQCRLKFFFRYVMQVPKPPTASMHAGTTVHRVLQEWSLARLHSQTLPLEHWQQRFQRQWITLQQNLKIVWDGEERDQFESAWRVLQHYFTATPIQEDEPPEAVEVPLEQELDASGSPKLVGIIDLIRPIGRITDFKVVGRTPDAGQLVQVHELQLTAYSILYRARTGVKETGLELHHLVRTKVPRLIVSSLPPATERQHTRFFRLVGSYMEGLRRRDFVPSPGLQCAACEYFEHCREWCG